MKIKIDRRPLAEQYAELSGMEKFLTWMLIPAIMQAITLWAFIATL